MLVLLHAAALAIKTATQYATVRYFSTRESHRRKLNVYNIKACEPRTCYSVVFARCPGILLQCPGAGRQPRLDPERRKLNIYTNKFRIDTALLSPLDPDTIAVILVRKKI